MSKRIIAIIRAARAPGRGLIRAIEEDREGGFAARAIARDADGEEARYLAARGAEVVAGQMGDLASLRDAFAGAYGAFSILLPGEAPFPEQRLADAHAMAQAAKDAGVEHVVWAILEGKPVARSFGDVDVDGDGASGRLVEGQQASRADILGETASVFRSLEVPTTFLRVCWPSTLATGRAAEEIGRYALGIFLRRELIGETVWMSPDPSALEPSGAQSGATAVPSGPLVPAQVPVPVPAPMAPPRPVGTRSIVIGAALVVSAGALVAASLARWASHEVETDRPVASAKRPGEAANAPPPLHAASLERLGDGSLARASSGTAPSQARSGIDRGPAPAILQRVASISPAGDISRTERRRRATVYRLQRPAPAATVMPGPGTAMAKATAVAMTASTAPVPARRARPAVNAGEAVGPSVRAMPRKLRGPFAAPPGSEPRSTPTGVMSAALEPASVAHGAVGASRSVATERAAGERSPSSVAAVVHSEARAPAPAIAAAPAGTVDRAAVVTTVQRHQPEVQACFDRALMDGNELRGRLTVRAAIDPGGRVVSASARSGINGGARLQACVVAAFKSWVFPAPLGGAAGEITYSFTFQ